MNFLVPLITGSLAVIGPALSARETLHPNVVFLLADDLGWRDLQCYGSPYYKTPNIDRLAAEGMLFTDAYAANPLCSPTRASILTGKYPGRMHLTEANCHIPPPPDYVEFPERVAGGMRVIAPNARFHLEPSEHTMAAAFREAGYATPFIGKWHLGAREEWWPKAFGFDSNLGGGDYPGPPSYFSPYRIATLSDGPPGEYLTDRLTDEAVAFLKTPHEKPFLLTLWHYAVHAPFEAKPTLVSAWKNENDEPDGQDSPVMAAMIQSLDESVGRILKVLEVTGLKENTIVILTSDNGGNMYDRVEGKSPTNNAPLRGGKGSLYEGGVRVPLIVSWPGMIAPGSRSDAVVSSIDFYPTLLELAGILDSGRKKFDGMSFAPLLRGGPAPARDGIFWHFPHYISATETRPGTSLREGDWKAILLYGEGPDQTDRVELYNLKQDIGESKDVAAAHPERVAEMENKIRQHLAETNASVPRRNPDFDPQAYDIIAKPRIAKWMPSGTNKLREEGGILNLESFGNKPEITNSLIRGGTGKQVLSFRMRSDASGRGRLFWNAREDIVFGGAQAVFFDVAHDGQWHDYRVEIDTGADALNALLFWPARGAGTIEIADLRLTDASGRTLESWSFSKTPQP